MKKPEKYELKKWLCKNTIIGLKLHYYQTGTDTSATDWELFTSNGDSKRVRDGTVKTLVDIRPDWVRLIHVRDSVRKEIEAYDEFAKREAKDLEEYERLREKFEKE